MDVRIGKDEVEAIAILQFDRLMGGFPGKKSILVDDIAGVGGEGSDEEEGKKAFHGGADLRIRGGSFENFRAARWFETLFVDMLAP
jgi:hypothetical protein